MPNRRNTPDSEMFGQAETLPFKKRRPTNSYVFMLMQDTQYQTWPISVHNSQLSIEIDSEQSANDIVSASIAGNWRDDLFAEKFLDFMQKSSNALIYYGEVFFELILTYDSTNEERATGFRVEIVPNNNVYRIGKFYIGYQRKSTSEDSPTRIELVSGGPKTMFRTTIPKKVCSLRSYKRFLRTLEGLGRVVLPAFVLAEGGMENKIEFDTLGYHKTKNLFLARTTAKLGWTVRQSFEKETTEFYYWYRILLFEHSLALIREELIKTYNQILSEAGKVIGFEAQVVVNGALSSELLKNKLEEFQAGNLQIREITPLIFDWRNRTSQV